MCIQCATFHDLNDGVQFISTHLSEKKAVAGSMRQRKQMEWRFLEWQKEGGGCLVAMLVVGDKE